MPIESNTYGSSSTGPPLAGARILLVTDNGADGQSIGAILKQQGMHIFTATSAEQVLQLMRNRNPDLILMDMQIPDLDGFETARAIRHEKKFYEIPIIAMTIQTTTGNREKYFQVGMNDYLSKPIYPDRLITALRGWLTSRTPTNPPPRASAENRSYPAQLADALPGFDVTEALARLEGNIRFYLELLKDFRKNLIDARSNMRSLIRDGALDDALIRLHGLKGVCANLEALTLRKAFQNLELALATAQQEQYETLITRMEETIDQNLKNITTVLEAETDTDADAPSTDAVNMELLVETMQHLVRLLDQGRLDAVDSFENLKGLLPLRRRHPEFKDLAGFIRCLDYAKARKALIALAASMDIVL